MRKLLQILPLLAALALVAAPLTAGGISICDNTPGNLVHNCGFEIGDFSSWNTSGDSSFTGVSDDPFDNSGTYGAYLGSTGSDFYFNQTLDTAPGLPYTFSFYLESLDYGPSYFSAAWDSTTLLIFDSSISDPGPFGYTQFSYNVTGTGSDTISFTSYQRPSYWGLDDVVVTGNVPEPGSLGLLMSGIGLLAVGIRRRKK